MKRTVLSLLILTAFVLAACATATAPSLSGVITSIDGNSVTITPADGGSPQTVMVGWGTHVFHPDGLEAEGKSVLTAGQRVQVWLANGTQNVTRVNIQ